MAPSTQSTQQRSQSYQLLMELGRGGMGVVQLAMSRGPHGFVKLMVLKMLRAELLGDELSVRMFLQEARISARLAHPNIVQVYQVTEVEGVPTMVMEYLEGQPLSSVLGSGNDLPIPLGLYVVTKVLTGLHAAHELCDFDGTPLDLIHRDMSPHNVFVLFDGQVKLLDFGIVKAARSDVETQAGELKGKIRYMAPEQLMGLEIDRRADLFAVGIMLWELLAGRRLWEGMVDGDVMLSLLNNKLPPLPDTVPQQLVAICNRALAGEPAERYPTAEAFQRDLEAYLATCAENLSDATVATFIRERFAADREQRRKLIEEHISRSGRAAVAEEAEAVRRRDSAEHATSSLPQQVQIDERAGGARWLPLSVAIVALLVAVTTVLVVLTNGNVRGGRWNATNSAATMSASTSTTCAVGFKSCDGQCVSIDRPDYGCGGTSCAACSVANATARCNVNHECDIALCYQAYDNCDGSLANGCETRVRIDPDNCGGCDHKCPERPHSVRGCGDVCTIWRCEPGYRDCNGEIADGCEVKASEDPDNCGHCGTVCKRGQRCQKGECVP